jgi:hypothetical protein
MNRRKNKFDKFIDIINANPEKNLTTIVCIFGISFALIIMILSTIYF